MDVDSTRRFVRGKNTIYASRWLTDSGDHSMTYLRNLRAWLTGFRRFGELSFKAGWSADSWQWRLLYLFDYGSHVLSGGAVVSWSRWFYDNRNKRIPRFFDRLLNHFEDGHGRSAGPPLWGTQDCNPLFRCAAVALVLLGVWA